ncbi:hypothetical protein DSECCO2_463020 [anaerobic digester metagenome]
MTGRVLEPPGPEGLFGTPGEGDLLETPDGGLGPCRRFDPLERLERCLVLLLLHESLYPGITVEEIQEIGPLRCDRLADLFEHPDLGEEQRAGDDRGGGEPPPREDPKGREPLRRLEFGPKEGEVLLEPCRRRVVAPLVEAGGDRLEFQGEMVYQCGGKSATPRLIYPASEHTPLDPEGLGCAERCEPGERPGPEAVGAVGRGRELRRVSPGSAGLPVEEECKRVRRSRVRKRALLAHSPHVGDSPPGCGLAQGLDGIVEPEVLEVPVLVPEEVVEGVHSRVGGFVDRSRHR